MITRSQHLRIGAILGFPECCVQAWVGSLDAPEPLARTTGSVTERVRTLDEFRELAEQVSELLGVRWPFGAGATLGSDLRKCWVPCVPCAERYGSLGDRDVVIG